MRATGESSGRPTRYCSPAATGFSTKDLLSVARQLDLDPAEAEAALHERRYRERVLEDVAGADQAGVHGTPTFFVGAERLEGSWRRLAQLVPAMLDRG